MNFLTAPLGALPIGIWVVGVLLAISLLVGSVGQLISVVSWEKARSLGLQEDDPKSADPMERSLVPVEWGTAVADIILQTAAIILAFYGIVQRNWLGLFGATMEFTILLYAALFYFFQRYGIKVWKTGDWTHWKKIAIGFLIFAGSIGLVGLVCLWSNRQYF